jgi:hypothetical protein
VDLKITIAVPRVVHGISSGPGWLTLLLTFLVGSATALAVQLVVQLYVVPRVETRKRREDRWERDVRQLGELLTMRLTHLANEAHAAQLVYRTVRDDQTDEYGPALVARQAMDAEQTTWAYGDLIGTQVDWLVRRVQSPSPNAQEISQLKRLAGEYRAQAVHVRVLSDDDQRTETKFHETWKKESNAREALIKQVELLADLPRPPRAPWRQSAGDWHDLLGGADPIPRQGRA